MGYYSKFPSKIKRTKGTKLFRVLNYVGFGFLSVSTIIAIAINYTPVMQHIAQELRDSNFGLTEEELEKKAVMQMSILPKKYETLLLEKERDKNFDNVNIKEY